MHQKEQVMAPILESGLGVHCSTINNFDTDQFGTFTSEILRETDALSAARKKCLAVFENSTCDLAIASEGSFGPHPSAFFASADDELVMLKDKRSNLEIISRVVSFTTNFSSREIVTETELLEFAAQVHFPSHGLILRPSQNETLDMKKGIQSFEILLSHFNFLLQKYQKVFVETDMRALYNPTRLEIIEMATKQLVENALSLCQECNTPGFVVTDVVRGLPCSWCGSATTSIISHIYKCKACGFQKEHLFPNHKKSEDPGFCNYCNP